MEQQSFLGKIWTMFKQSLSITKKYFLARILICLILGVLSAVVFALLKFPLWWLLGIIVGTLNIVPMFGPWASAAIVAVILLFFEPVYALYAVFVVLATQVLDEFLLTPLLLGNAIDLKPLTILVVVMLAGSFLGFWGILFALPIAASLKAAYKLFFARPPEVKNTSSSGDGDTTPRGE